MKKGKFFLLGMLVLLLTFGFSLTGCSDGGGDGGGNVPDGSSDMATLEIENLSIVPGEIIVEVTWATRDTFKRNITNIPVNGIQSFTLEPDDYFIHVANNDGDWDEMDITLNAGRKYTLRWMNYRLTR